MGPPGDEEGRRSLAHLRCSAVNIPQLLLINRQKNTHPNSRQYSSFSSLHSRQSLAIFASHTFHPISFFLFNFFYLLFLSSFFFSVFLLLLVILFTFHFRLSQVLPLFSFYSLSLTLLSSRLLFNPVWIITHSVHPSALRSTAPNISL